MIALTCPDNGVHIEWRIVDEKVSGDTADVLGTITFSNDGRLGTSGGTVELVKENGEWKVCDPATTGPDGARRRFRPGRG